MSILLQSLFGFFDDFGFSFFGCGRPGGDFFR
jgi:hypothetical protein